MQPETPTDTAISHALAVQELRKQYDKITAVDDVSFQVGRGEIVGLVGPNGAGKTTTINMVLGVLQPTSGRIFIGGIDIARRRAQALERTNFAAVYAALPGNLTVEENLTFFGLLYGIPRLRARVDELISEFDLKKLRRTKCGLLSSGEQTRAALAKALLNRPQLLLLDEPLSNLDAKLRLRLRDDLRVILKATGMTALYVTHDQAEAVVLGDRIGVMRDGKLLQMGTPDQIYNRPADLFVANFTGATNELTGTLVGRNGAFGVVDFGDGRKGEAALLHAMEVGDKVRIALRPENIGIGKQESANSFSARVLDRRYQGTQTVYEIDLFGRRLEALELGTAARHQVGVETSVYLPREGCWAYRDTGPSTYE